MFFCFYNYLTHRLVTDAPLALKLTLCAIRRSRSALHLVIVPSRLCSTSPSCRTALLRSSSLCPALPNIAVIHVMYSDIRFDSLWLREETL